MAVIASYAADRLRQSGKFSTVAIRKSFTMLAIFMPGLLMVVQALFGYNATLSVVIFTTALFCNGAVTGGYLSNGLDIAPNFSGTIMGIANTVSSIGGWFTTFIVAIITSESSTFAEWRYVFWILVGVYMFGAFNFLIFGSGTVQPWNSTKPTGQSIKFAQELQPLKKTENDVAA